MRPSTIRKSSRKDALFEQFLAHVPPQTAETFTDAQVEALKQACSQLNWKKHPVDIRLSVPVPFNRFYLVILAGPERRSRQRLQTEAHRYPVWTTTNTVALAIVFCLLLLSTLGLQKAVLPTLTKLTELKPHATNLPWIDSEAECHNTLRTWEDGKCRDWTNDPNF
ncbi:MAG: hypothetical protein HC840_30685 [Leptolyngbyaceae cyanobacterium RM2_2_4]|nr:hypothetical protein [Leptolyngbyaceae cyanobacterium SM1_4_3]NJN89401.1 hypothetical protein [Leptolyngbyaceae cyanobacterium SL_5_14]NJO53035.1 hypothetical protein [Leptolyngbyaceae cyanobacterium RM2_2_4]NJO67317.1 hypothetical protein [Leptolyngbyaceae cyanobacterium RM1_405_57]